MCKRVGGVVYSDSLTCNVTANLTRQVLLTKTAQKKHSEKIIKKNTNSNFVVRCFFFSDRHTTFFTAHIQRLLSLS